MRSKMVWKRLFSSVLSEETEEFVRITDVVPGGKLTVMVLPVRRLNNWVRLNVARAFDICVPPFWLDDSPLPQFSIPPMKENNVG